MRFQGIPSGSFKMGIRGESKKEEPLHSVTINKPFYLGRYPVTQSQFSQWNPIHKNGFPNLPNNPVEQVDWYEANQFCTWINDCLANELPKNFLAALPTEAEWEYACRAETDTEYYSGDGIVALATVGWFDGNSNSQTQQVGLLKANNFGLSDMHGNVWEWCADAWDEHIYKKRVNGVSDPFEIGTSKSYRVLRGGGINNAPKFCRTSYRGRWKPENRFWNQGFRVCLVADTQALKRSPSRNSLDKKME